MNEYEEKTGRKGIVYVFLWEVKGSMNVSLANYKIQHHIPTVCPLLLYHLSFSLTHHQLAQTLSPFSLINLYPTPNFFG